jgi:hypothetical protein
MPRFSRATEALSALVLLLAASTAAGQTIDESFAVEGGTLVEGCGGFAGGCRDYRLRGELGLQLDLAAATASIHRSSLEIGLPGEGFRGLTLPVDEIAGTIEDGAIRLVSRPGSGITFDWTLTPTDAGLILQGLYDQGCCDLYAFDFRNVSFAELASREPATVLLLDGGRFGVEVGFEDFEGNPGVARAVAQGDDSGYFWFFDAGSTEVVVKLIDACRSFDRFWFFAAGLTNLRVEITVTDFRTGTERVYRNPMGRTFETILDVEAFATCSRGR